MKAKGVSASNKKLPNLALLRRNFLATFLVIACGCQNGSDQALDSDEPTQRTEIELTPQQREIFEAPVETNSIGIQLKELPAGEFIMGSDNGEDNAKPALQVVLTDPFFISVHEVTQAQYEEVMGTNPSQFKSPRNPVEQVRWEMAVEFCRRLSELPAEKAAGHVYRLPTEAEWEYACRAGTETRFNFGDDGSALTDFAWYSDNEGSTTQPVGKKSPNAWGLFDMHGNAAEWVQDWYADYPDGPQTNPSGPAESSFRVYRGGSWFSNASSCESSYRFGVVPPFRNNYLGFRVVR